MIENINVAGGRPWIIATGFTALLACFWLHAFAFYALMTRLGATAAGVCKGLQAVGVLGTFHHNQILPPRPALPAFLFLPLLLTVCP